MARTLLLVSVILMAVPLALSAQGPGDLLVTPTRAVFENNKRFETLTLINRGADSMSYRIEVVQYRMTATGELERIASPDPGQLVATDFIKFFPREVTLAPGGSQNVRVQIRVPENLAAGEYRSHLYFRGVPRQASADSAVDSSGAEFAVKMTAVYGVTIPVIVRNGALNAAVRLDSLRLIPAGPTRRAMLSMQFLRDGTQSVAGMVRVTYIPPAGDAVEVAAIGGVAVYTPNRNRGFTVALRTPPGLELKGGRLRVEYESSSDASATLLASAETTLE